MMSIAATDLNEQIAELRFCIEELHRRQTSNWGRAWLWQLKENAARQALAMLRAEVEDISTDELSDAEQRRLIASHELLKNPRAAARASDVPKWRQALQARARQSLQEALNLFHRRDQNVHKSQE